MHSDFHGCWLLWSRLFSPIFLPHIPLCVSLCPIFPASSSSVVSSFLSLEEELLSLLSFPVFTPFHPLSLFLLFFLFPLVLSFLPCFLLLHSHFLLISPLSFQLFLSFLLCSVTLFFLSVLLPFYISFFPLFSIFISPPHASLLSPFLFPSHLLLPSSKLSAFLSSPLTFSSSFCLYPHLSPFLPASLLSLCFCACCFSILCREHSCDANYIDWRKGEGEREREGGRWEEEEKGRGLEDLCMCTQTHTNTHIRADGGKE